jgi:FKBP-type peptidyl-prolyl cis-trans isomerase SlpA
MQQWVARKLLDAMGDPNEHYAWVMWCSSPRPMARAVCRRGAAGGHAEDEAVLFDFNHPLAGPAGDV